MSETGAARRVTFRDVLGNREFRALYLAQTLSLAGDNLARIALALLVFSRTGSALLTGATFAVSFVPWLVGGPILSTIADRLPRRRVMAACDISRTGLIALAAIPGLPILAILALVLLIAFLEVPFSSARSATIPDVIGEGDEYAAAATLSNTTAQFGGVLGYAFGGALVALIGSREILLLDAATFAVSAVVILARLRDRPLLRQNVDSTWLSDMAEGVRVVFTDARLRWLVVVAWIVVGTTIATDALAVPYAASHGRGDVTAGLLTAAQSIGAVIGALSLNRFVSRQTAERLMLPMAVATPVILAFTAFNPNVWIVGVLWVLGGAGSVMSITANRVFVALVPRELRGRAFGVAAGGIAGIQGLVAIIAGALADGVGPAIAVADIALPALALIVIVSLLSAPFRSRPEPPSTDEGPVQDDAPPKDATMPSAKTRPQLRLALYIGLLVVVGGVALVAFRNVGSYRSAGIHTWWILALFVIATAYPLSFDFRRQAWSVSLETVPLVFGILFLSPDRLILSVVASVLIVHALLRRQQFIRWAFNVASQVCATATTVAVFRLLRPAGNAIHVSSWPAAFGAVLINDVASAALLIVVVSLAEGAWQLRSALRILAFSIPVTLVATCLALPTAAGLAYDGDTAWIITIFLILSVVAMQTFHRLSERTQALDRLYDVAREMGPIAADPGDLAPALAQLRRVLRASRLELSVVSSAAPDFATVVAVFEDSQSERVAVESQPLEGGIADLLSSVTGRARWSWLPASSRRSRRESDRLSTAVVTNGKPIGVLSANGRSDPTLSFEIGDAQLLEAAAEQLAAALEKGRLVESLRRAATLDSLTGLANLDSFREFVTTMLDAGGGGVVLLLDVDRFSEVNDMLGHDAGDSVLVEVSRRLDSSPAHGALSARIGGDQFALAIPGAAGSEVARLAALAVKSRVDGSLRFAEVSADVRVTIGVARAPEHGNDVATILRRAEMAMTAAKGTSAGIGEWEPDYERDGSRRLQLLTGLRTALGDNSLRVEYQPKLRLGSGEVVGFEALVRWRHPDLGPVSPAEFVPLAEATGLIAALTSNVLRMALTTCRTWHDAGKPVGIAVNISARSLDDPVLVGQVAAMLTASGLEPRWLTLEITESSVMENHARSLEVLRQLRMLGVRLSIDDFGTGYSSLHQLRGLPVHEVKIDRSFVESVDRDGTDRAVVRAVVELCDSLGLSTVAEGVERSSQAYALESLGVSLVQGFFHGRPMAPTAALEWLLPRRTASADVSVPETRYGS
jgi:diguanylate cyclase (GGDEF)-like protein